MAMEKSDRIALGIGFAALAIVTVGVLYAIRCVGGGLLGIIDVAGGGVGFQTAFLWGLGISTLLVVLFALVSGGGDVVGELPFVLIGFFVLIAFFTGAIALIL